MAHQLPLIITTNPHFLSRKPLHDEMLPAFALRELFQKDDPLSYFKQDPQGWIKVRDHQGKHILHYLARYGNAELIKRFLGYHPPLKALINQPDNNGRTPLHDAVQKGNLPAVKVLLENGANPHARDKEGYTVAYTAALHLPPDSLAQFVRLVAPYRLDWNITPNDLRYSVLDLLRSREFHHTPAYDLIQSQGGKHIIKIFP
ncbi:MAG: ankyrin repeat domain-containing protein [Candidatus Micrarchaeota archaeon]|nr:ankyrin repeat domain-containing protein [Candidatus Micrarchaeota archaeon]